MLTKLKLDRDRTNLLARKAAKGVNKPKGEKYTEKDVKNFTRLQYVGDALKSCEYSN